MCPVKIASAAFRIFSSCPKGKQDLFLFCSLDTVFFGGLFVCLLLLLLSFLSVVHRAFFFYFNFYSFCFCHRFKLFRIIVCNCSVCEMWWPLAAACIHIWFPCGCSDSKCPVKIASAALRIFAIHSEREQDFFPAMVDGRLLKWWPHEYQTASPSSQRWK